MQLPSPDFPMTQIPETDSWATKLALLFENRPCHRREDYSLSLGRVECLGKSVAPS